MLTPVDLETTVFRRGFRGYQVREVQDFMARLLQDYERLYRENIELKEKLEAVEIKLSSYQQTEETLRNALLLAEHTAGEVRQASQKQAELMLREAEHRADQVRVRVKDEIRMELERLAALKQQAEFFRIQFKNFLVLPGRPGRPPAQYGCDLGRSFQEGRRGRSPAESARPEQPNRDEDAKGA